MRSRDIDVVAEAGGCRYLEMSAALTVDDMHYPSISPGLIGFQAVVDGAREVVRGAAQSTF